MANWFSSLMPTSAAFLPRGLSRWRRTCMTRRHGSKAAVGSVVHPFRSTAAQLAARSVQQQHITCQYRTDLGGS
jgi:hypothetical protein